VWAAGGPRGPQQPRGIASAPQRSKGDLGAAITRSGREGSRFTPDGRHIVLGHGNNTLSVLHVAPPVK